nr:MAG TPA: hypothetical protein [Caudoviricetes sp.]
MARNKPQETEHICPAEERGQLPSVAGTRNTETKIRNNTVPEKQKKIYVGASLPGIRSYTVFAGEVPAQLKEIPFVKELVIPLNQLAKYERNKREDGTREQFCYEQSVIYTQQLRK